MIDELNVVEIRNTSRKQCGSFAASLTLSVHSYIQDHRYYSWLTWTMQDSA